MCGIVGILARKTQIPPAVLEQATRSLAHRGPDDSGTVLLKETQAEPVEIGLGHRRLAILTFRRSGISPCRIRLPATGSYSTARSTTSANFGRNSNPPASSSKVIPILK